MLKQIPKSDINYRPFKVYKTFTVTDINPLLAYNHTGSTDVLSDYELQEQGLYHQLYTMYYRDPHNPFTSYGDIIPISESYNDVNISQRYLHETAYVLPIPQKMYGEKIKPGSIILTSNTIEETLIDDAYGNLISNKNQFTLIELNVDNGTFKFSDAFNKIYTFTFETINLENGTITLTGQTNTFTNFYANINDNFVSFNGIIIGTDFVNFPIGNVFYSHGIITITKNVLGLRTEFFEDYDLEYKSTNTIYENEILLVVDEDEFNVSTNPTALIEDNIVTGSIELNNYTNYQIDARNANLLGGDGGYVLYNDTNSNEVTLAIDQNIIYNFSASEIIYNSLIGCSLQSFKKNEVSWRNSDKYQKPIFADYEYSSSIDPTGSYLAPYITTIGLYDDNMDMVAVAKLATPIKSTPDLPVNFLVRFDT